MSKSMQVGPHWISDDAIILSPTSGKTEKIVILQVKKNLKTLFSFLILILILIPAMKGTSCSIEKKR